MPNLLLRSLIEINLLYSSNLLSAFAHHYLTGLSSYNQIVILLQFIQISAEIPNEPSVLMKTLL